MHSTLQPINDMHLFVPCSCKEDGVEWKRFVWVQAKRGFNLLEFIVRNLGYQQLVFVLNQKLLIKMWKWFLKFFLRVTGCGEITVFNYS